MGIPSPEGAGRVQSDDASRRTVSSSGHDVEPISPAGTAGPRHSPPTRHERRPQDLLPRSQVMDSARRYLLAHVKFRTTKDIQPWKARFQILHLPHALHPHSIHLLLSDYQVRGCRTGRLDFKVVCLEVWTRDEDHNGSATSLVPFPFPWILDRAQIPPRDFHRLPPLRRFQPRPFVPSSRGPLDSHPPTQPPFTGTLKLFPGEGDALNFLLWL